MSLLAHRHVASRRPTAHEHDADDDQNDRTRDEDLKCPATKVGVDTEDLLDPVHHKPPARICAYALHAGGYPLRDLCVRKRVGSARTLFRGEDSICLLADVPARPAPE